MKGESLTAIDPHEKLLLICHDYDVPSRGDDV
jgi:hypothetical protein